MDERQEILEVFDAHDQLIGRATRETIHRLGLRHRTVHILVCHPDGRLYLQLRGEHKDRFPGHWDTSAAGHVSPGESYAAAASRELEEELGLQAPLQVRAQVAACPQTGWEHVLLFECRTAVPPIPNPLEIQRGVFFELAEIDRLLENPGWPVTPAFRHLYGLWRRRQPAPPADGGHP